jgi:hypothetical protein
MLTQEPRVVCDVLDDPGAFKVWIVVDDTPKSR